MTPNAADLRMKTRSLKHIINHFKASIFSVQETHYKKKGKYCQDNFQIFEAIHKKEGGGSMLGVHVSLKPVLISEYIDTFELLVVEVKVETKCKRILTGYGPQENWEIDVKMKLFTALEEELLNAALKGDLNSKLGPEFIKDDTKPMTDNGQILGGIIDRNALTVVNGIRKKNVKG